MEYNNNDNNNNNNNNNNNICTLCTKLIIEISKLRINYTGALLGDACMNKNGIGIYTGINRLIISNMKYESS